MGVKRKTHRFKGGDIIETEEFHDGNYGAPGKKRQDKRKPTSEQMQRANAINKAKRARHRLLMYFDIGDCFATWTYEKKNRPPNMKGALVDFQKAIRYVRTQYKKRGYELFWIRNIERGTKGAWHIHLVVNMIDDTASILQKAWKKGGTYVSEIQYNPKVYDDCEDFSKLASYITKDEHTVEEKEDGTKAKPRLKETSYSTSRNMPLPKPKPDKLVRWKEELKPKKGYYIARIWEGENPATGLKYRRCTMIRLKRRWKGGRSKHLHRGKKPLPKMRP